MEVSQQFKTTHYSVPSPDSAYIASLNGARLQIRSTISLELIRSISLPSEQNIRGTVIRWAPVPDNGRSRRFFLSDENNARVWDLYDEKWTAVINNGSGGMGKIVNGDFGCTEDEVILFSDFGAKVTIWSLASGRSVEIKDPKFSTVKGYGYRLKTGIFALLSRPAGQDIVTLHAPGTYFVLKTITLASVDAQGLRWSPDGRWLVVWDAPSSGYRVLVYTADGHLFRMYSGEREGEVCGLGVKCVEWTPRGDGLAIGGWDKRVTLLSTRTFSPVVFLDHTPSVQLTNGSVWQEAVSASSARSYAITAQPISPPVAVSSPSDSSPKVGISIAAFNADGTLVATRDDSTPTTVWLWDLTHMASRTVIIQHAPVKHLLWHPTIPDLLLIQCAHDDPVLYLWSSTANAPEIITVSLQKGLGNTAARLESKWLPTPRDRKPALIFGHTQSYILVWPQGRDPILKFEHDGEEREGEREDDSEDSLYNILTGRTPVPRLDNSIRDFEADEGDDSAGLEDTFRERRARDSGLDEMF
ncbi:WD40 repeat-like protein [Lepidopterella palustris CBS 459.81]|uniref:WD40 repeat-like protein n=1 Tax=Lepidopterella palustris CBS 459.81 TaxID=1314670 RepID=A0A8E2J9Z3_9PEZI|nr:WD40 repeat-like protein [Lepidopterella palustris CBS 459.81]